MATKFSKKQIEATMKAFKCDEAEAIEILKYDDAVDHNEETEFDLTAEQKAVVQTMMRQTDHKKGEERKGKKVERKPNELKEAIVAELFNYLAENSLEQDYHDVEVTNPNRMIAFKVGEKSFELTLTEKRPPKSK